jgi:hypothetical protein
MPSYKTDEDRVGVMIVESDRPRCSLLPLLALAPYYRDMRYQDIITIEPGKRGG